MGDAPEGFEPVIMFGSPIRGTAALPRFVAWECQTCGALLRANSPLIRMHRVRHRAEPFEVTITETDTTGETRTWWSGG